MFNIIESFIKKLTKEDINKFALSKNIVLEPKELDFTFDFVKKNYKDFFSNPKLFNIDRYQNNYSKENFSKITKVYQEYMQKYANYL